MGDTASAMALARGLLMLNLLTDMDSATVPGLVDISTPPPSDMALAMALARGLLMLSLLMDMESATAPGLVDISTPPPLDMASAMVSARGRPSLLMALDLVSATEPLDAFTPPPSATAMVFMARGPPMPLMVMVTSEWPGATRW